MPAPRPAHAHLYRSASAAGWLTTPTVTRHRPAGQPSSLPVSPASQRRPPPTLRASPSQSLLIFTARRNAHIASTVLATAIPSVCLSVRPSVRPSVCHTPVLCQNDGTYHGAVCTLR